MSGFLSMIWHDEFLIWNMSKHPDTPHLTIPTTGIWRPDLHLYQNVDRNFESFKEVGATLYSDGTVDWITPFILQTSCRIDARLFPFDTQHCILRFGSWSYDLKRLNLVGSPSTTNESTFKNSFIENGIWELAALELERFVNDYGGAGLYPELVFTVALTRRPLFHILSFILPCALLSILNLLVFILPTASGEKVSLGITNLLALVLFQQLIGDSLPPSSKNMPIISYYFAPMILIGCLSIVSGVLVAALYHQDRAKPVPACLRKIFRLPSSMKDQRSDARSSDDNNDSASTPINSNNHDSFRKRSLQAVSHGNESPLVEYAGGQVKRVFEKERFRNQLDDDKNEWQQIASAVDSIMLAVACVLTLSAVAITMALFLINTE